MTKQKNMNFINSNQCDASDTVSCVTGITSQQNSYKFLHCQIEIIRNGSFHSQKKYTRYKFQYHY